MNTTHATEAAEVQAPAASVFNTHELVYRKEQHMGKLGYFIGGFIAGAASIVAAAFLVDSTFDDCAELEADPVESSMKSEEHADSDREMNAARVSGKVSDNL